MNGPSDARETMRLLRRLASPGAVLIAEAGGGYRLQPGSSAGARGPSAPIVLVQRLLAEGLAVVASDGNVAITSEGLAALRRAMSGADGFAAQHQTRVTATIDTEAGRQSVTVNADESPLAWLRRRKGRDGRPMVDASQFEAGERLRADFERGRLQARITANWSAAVASGRRSGGASGAVELTEAALSARQRVEKAITAVGPELGGLLLDFCCFLKGIEAIEQERSWPARSAKLVLQLALTSLARHYGLMPAASGPRHSLGLRHWGADDYRPTIG